MVLVTAELIALVLLLGVFAGPILARSPWTVGHPGTAVLCWAGAVIGTVTATATLVVLALLWPPSPGHDLLELLHTCLPRHQHAGLAWASVASVALVGFCYLRLSRGVPRVWRTVFHRRRHREMLRMIAHADGHHDDVLVLDHPLPVAYCLPARSRPIVVSSGARERLNSAELAAVLAHERAHLRQRHHMLLLMLDLVHATLPWLPTFRLAKAAVPPLLEMAADDAAAGRHGRHVLAAALRRLVLLPGPDGALAATGSSGRPLTQQRLARLESSATGSSGRVPALVTAICTLAGPVATAVLILTTLPLPC